MQFERPNVGKRLASMLLDHFLTCFILIVPIILFLSLTDIPFGKGSPMPPGFQFVFLGLMVLYFLKDSFNGRSIAKRVTKLQVVDIRTGNSASVGKCFIRNLTVIIWPIEVIIILFSPHRRLGDFIAGTKVVNYGSSEIPTFDFERTAR